MKKLKFVRINRDEYERVLLVPGGGELNQHEVALMHAMRRSRAHARHLEVIAAVIRLSLSYYFTLGPVATEVATGRLRLFRRDELTLDAVLARSPH